MSPFVSNRNCFGRLPNPIMEKRTFFSRPLFRFLIVLRHEFIRYCTSICIGPENNKTIPDVCPYIDNIFILYPIQTLRICHEMQSMMIIKVLRIKVMHSLKLSLKFWEFKLTIYLVINLIIFQISICLFFVMWTTRGKIQYSSNCFSRTCIDIRFSLPITKRRNSGHAC